MKKVFIDSSVLVAACVSKTGASALILGYCRKKKIAGMLSLDVIGEARKNVNLKLGKLAKNRLKFYLKSANLNLIPQPSAEKIAECEKVIAKKDSPILAACLESPAQYFITLDRKDFVKPKVKEFSKPVQILLPGEFVTREISASS